jgi:hypothetical protein
MPPMVATTVSQRLKISPLVTKGPISDQSKKEKSREPMSSLPTGRP